MHQFDPHERNYWGYMPLNFFTPHRPYAADLEHARDEFRAMVKALHAADIEVILDVVYNHTAEGNQTGPTYSFKGIDNSTYYLTTADRATTLSAIIPVAETHSLANPAACGHWSWTA